MKIITKLAVLLALCFTVGACATTSATTDGATCASLDWAGCGQATHCRAARAWDAQDQETWACENHYPTVDEGMTPVAAAIARR